MKRLLNVLLLLAVAMAASAQISWNVRGGVGMAFPSFEQKSKAGIAAKFDVGCEIPLSSNISFMPSVGLEYMAAEFISWDERYNRLPNGDYAYTPHYDVSEANISRPIASLLFGYRVPIGTTDCSLMAKLGPYVAYAFTDFFNSGMSVDVGVGIGVDFEYRRFIVGASLEYGFVKDHYPYGHHLQEDYTNRAAFFNIGYKF